MARVQLANDQGSSATVEVIAKNGYVVRVSEQATAEHVWRILQTISELPETC